jgi:hypothetical protein
MPPIKALALYGEMDIDCSQQFARSGPERVRSTSSNASTSRIAGMGHRFVGEDDPMRPLIAHP